MLGLRKPGLLRLGLLLGLAVALCGMLDGSGRAGVRGVNAEQNSDWDFDVGNGEQKVWKAGTGAEEKESYGKGWTLEEINEELQECRIVQILNNQQSTYSPSGSSEELSTWTQTLFSYLFPFGPAGNSLLATAYISGPPNFLLALVPPDIDPSRLSIMVAFAIGGLLGDTLLHLIPGSFGLGGEDGGPVREGVEFVIKSDRKNLLVGMMVMVGFVVFVAMDKALRVAGMRWGGGHSHSHSHSSSQGQSSSLDEKPKGELRKRKTSANGKTSEAEKEVEEVEKVQEVKMSSYLNIIADFSHNITDGLAMSAAFYASPTIGATTMIGVFFHEIPHEVGDFALLVQSGFTKWQAMAAQFVTAIGAFLGTFLGIAIQWYAVKEDTELGGTGIPWNKGIWNTGLSGGDLVLPFTAGTFLYVGFSAVPELLEVDESKGRGAEMKRSLLQLMAMVAGFAIMFCVS